MNKPELPTPVGDGYSAMFKPGEKASLYKETRVIVTGVDVVTLSQCEQYAKDYAKWVAYRLGRCWGWPWM